MDCRYICNVVSVELYITNDVQFGVYTRVVYNLAADIWYKYLECSSRIYR